MMHICSARVELDLPSRSLKDKRHIVKRLLARARKTLDVQGSAALGFVTVSSSAAYAYQLVQQLEGWIERERPDVQVVIVEIERL